MPSKSPAQARLMAAAAHNPAFAKKVGVPVKVAKEFNKADTGGKMLRAPKPAESGRPTVIHATDKNNNSGKQVKETQRRIGILGALAKSMVKSNTRV